MEVHMDHGDRYTRFARHGRLYRLYLSAGDDAAAREHLQKCRELTPEAPDQAVWWQRLLGGDGKVEGKA